MGCRLPGGVDGPDDYWNLLMTGGDGVTDIPPDRWDVEKTYDPDPAASGKMYVKRGAFIENVRGFDPYLFGITPREAVAIDPQQRLLLEVSWEALENAGVAPDSLRGSDIGVFVGITNDDYAARCGIWSEFESIDNFTFTGVARSVASGRIAYAFDFRGPAVQLDTACSSSLMAVYQACQSLSLGECDLALAGGVNLMLSPATTISLCKLNVLSPDGVCRAFDAGANGYVRGEGGGIAVLKRLSDAKADNDRIFAVIRGAAVNHDGSSNGIAAPNGAAQRQLLERALNAADLDRQRVSYVEAHGTRGAPPLLASRCRPRPGFHVGRFAPRGCRPAGTRRLLQRHRSPGTLATAVPRAALPSGAVGKVFGHPAAIGAGREGEAVRSFRRGERGRDRERFPTRSSTHRHQPG